MKCATLVDGKAVIWDEPSDLFIPAFALQTSYSLRRFRMCERGCAQDS